MEKGLAIITGADGGMGQVITAALAKEGYPVIMACLDPEKADRSAGNQSRFPLIRKQFYRSIIKRRTSRQPPDEQCRNPDDSGTQN